MTRRFALAALPAVVAGSLVIGACGGKKPPAAVPEKPAEAPKVLSMSLEAKAPTTAALDSFGHDAQGPVKAGDHVGFTAKATVPPGGRLVVVAGGRVVPMSTGSDGKTFSGSWTVPEDLAAGRYPVEARVLDPAGKELVKRSGNALDVVLDPMAVLAKALEDLRVPFAYDSSSLSQEAKDVLVRISDALKRSGVKGVQLCVEGHCDQRGTVEYNIALGDRRAKAALAYLATLGPVPAADMKPVSYGKERLLDSADNDAAYAKNRRAEVRIGPCTH